MRHDEACPALVNLPRLRFPVVSVGRWFPETPLKGGLWGNQSDLGFCGTGSRGRNHLGAGNHPEPRTEGSDRR